MGKSLWIQTWTKNCGIHESQESRHRRSSRRASRADRSAEFQVRVETVSERRRSYDDVGGIVGDIGVTAKMESAFTKKSVDLAHQVVKFFVRLGVEFVFDIEMVRVFDTKTRVSINYFRITRISMISLRICKTVWKSSLS